MTTLRVISKYGENGGEWFCEPENKARLEYVQKTVAEMQQVEPTYGWKLQCRGTDLGWHDFQESCYHPTTRNDETLIS